MITSMKLAAAAAMVAGGLGFASAASAAPAVAHSAGVLGADGLVTTVADGCGRGFFRGPYGGCRPFYGRPAFGPRRFYGRRCFIRPGRFGPVRVCRF